MKKILIILISSFAILSLGGDLGFAAKVKKKTVLSDVYLVDGIYKSMMGPQSMQQIKLLDSSEPELLWITGYKAVMKDADGKKTMPQEYMCHSNLDFVPWNHRKHYGSRQAVNGRLFTLSQGQLEVELPKGFGIPVVANEPLSLTTQVLNNNPIDDPIQVRHQVTVNFVRNKDLKKPMKPLFTSSAYGLVVLNAEQSQGYYQVDNPDKEKHGPGCLAGLNASGHTYPDAQGRRFTGHWVVKPGREVNHTYATRTMNLPYDTTIHYIAVHLHPFAESLELRDLTTGETLFKSKVRPFKDKIGIDHVDYYSSEEGIPVFTDHEYEIVSVYNNTSGEDQDSMAVMYMYLLDKGFHYSDSK